MAPLRRPAGAAARHSDRIAAVTVVLVKINGPNTFPHPTRSPSPSLRTLLSFLRFVFPFPGACFCTPDEGDFCTFHTISKLTFWMKPVTGKFLRGSSRKILSRSFPGGNCVPLSRIAEECPGAGQDKSPALKLPYTTNRASPKMPPTTEQRNRGDSQR